MKTYMLFSIGCLLPLCLSAQPSRQLGSLPRWYIGTDAFIRRENIKLVESGQTIAPSNWMWNLSYGFNVGYQPNKWLTLESGLYRFTFARRVNFRFGVHPGRSFSTPWTVNTIPVRVYFNPFASRQNQHTRNKIQLVAGFSYGSLMKYEGEPTGSFGGLRRYFINDIVVDSLTFESTNQITNGRVLNLEGGVNVSRRLSSRLTVSATYGFTYGLNQVHRQNIQYRLSSTGQDYQGQQTSTGSSRTILFGLKYHLGKYPNSNRPDLHKSKLPLH
jgi:hypothetical protein